VAAVVAGVAGTPSQGVSAGPSVVATFAKNLGPGATSPDIKRLQQLLNSDPDTKIASSGIGSPGKETNYYGALTVLAVQKFQKKYGLASEGTPSTTGYGALGPKTRAALEERFGGMTAGAPETVSPAPSVVSASPSAPVQMPVVVLTAALARGKTHTDVKALQQVLNSDPATQITSSGVGSPGNETDYYGALTEKAVQKFQEKYGLAQAGDPGYGSVGPKTRAKINELASAPKQAQPAEMVTPPAAAPAGAVPSGSGNEDAKAAIEKQIQDALKKIKEISAQIQKAS